MPDQSQDRQESGCAQMKYARIPFVDQPVSRIILGGSGGRFLSGGDIGDIMDAALACGINAVDTARVYGRSEEALGRWLKEGQRRDRVVIISKGCHPSMAFHRRVNARAAGDDLKQSLEALNTDHIDVSLLHRDDPSVPVGAILEFLNRFHEDGLIGAFGGSNWTAKRIAEANAYAEEHGLAGFTVSSPHYSLGRQRHDPWGNGCKTATGGSHAEERRYYEDTQMPLVAWSSLCAGVFSGKLKSDEWGNLQKTFGINTRWAYGCRDNRERLSRCEKLAEEKNASVAQIALAWILKDSMSVFPVIGASGPARVRENAAAADIGLSDREYAWLNLEEE